MAPEEFATLLERLRDPRFDEAVRSLQEALQRGASRLFASPRLIPARELSDVYERRREHCRNIGLHVAGLDHLVDVLSAEPSASWVMIGFFGGGRWGVVFLKQATEPCACLAGSDDKAIAGPEMV
jgi:hypothetical protein